MTFNNETINQRSLIGAVDDRSTDDNMIDFNHKNSNIDTISYRKLITNNLN